MNRDIALEILTDWSPWGKRLPSGIKRNLYLDKLVESLGTNLIKVVVGFRRSGKSYLMRQLVDNLIDERGVNPNNIFFLNLEDDRLNTELTLKSLRNVFEIYLQVLRPKGKIYLFLDEIQLVPAFEKFLRTLYELKNREIEIFITGSNSRLLSSEISSSLSGRFMEFMIFPLNFREFLKFKDVSIKNVIDFSKHKQKILAYFEEYLEYGALPEILFLANAEQKINYLRGIFAKIVLDDVVKRFKIREVDVFEKVIKFILSNIGRVTSVTKIVKYIDGSSNKARDLSISKYIDYTKQAFLFFELARFDWKLKRAFETNKKYYALDLGIRECHKINTTNDYSQKIENIIFLKLQQDDAKCYYGINRAGREIDFLIERKNKIFDKYQVCSDLNKQNLKRELGSFVLADKYLAGGKNILLTMNDDKRIEYKNLVLQEKNIVKFLLDL